jgi:hypothetical protein
VLPRTEAKLPSRTISIHPDTSFFVCLVTVCKLEHCQAGQLCFSVLEPVRRPVVKGNWSELRKVPRKQRREMRQKLQQESNVDISSDHSEELR